MVKLTLKENRTSNLLSLTHLSGAEQTRLESSTISCVYWNHKTTWRKLQGLRSKSARFLLVFWKNLMLGKAPLARLLEIQTLKLTLPLAECHSRDKTTFLLSFPKYFHLIFISFFFFFSPMTCLLDCYRFICSPIWLYFTLLIKKLPMWYQVLTQLDIIPYEWSLL